MLFKKPLKQITFEDAQAFCETWPEGVRVEYKRLETDKIPKVVSSFANTFGGVWIIGTKTDKTTNRVVLPIEGIPFDPGIEERITQSCYANLYPPLLPDIQVLRVPDTGNAVVVVQVSESVEAPHAIENSTRVYIRTNSTTEPIELADVDRIDYLLQRRRNAEEKRSQRFSRLWELSSIGPCALKIEIGPRYPHLPVLTHEQLKARIRSHRDHVLIRDFSMPIRDGIMAPSPNVDYAKDLYFAANVHGCITYAKPIERKTSFDQSSKDCIYLGEILGILSEGLELAKVILKGISLNLRIDVNLNGIRKGVIVYRSLDGFQPTHPPTIESSSEAQEDFISEHLEDFDRKTTLTIDLVRQLMWPFNWHHVEQIEYAVRPSTADQH
ncbi:MAG: hypothetical protein Nkreftii_002690 [Candidatus Nitrospira kreftii]|uniref:Schlafen AlbA-2 domain-containing protein n=1 Tax=Candidatus Nitrospira kreftii TaxID=2652173 RepID=A0A7S8FFM0_9BACT|nr:MAG: hypothetical protein Nkreftii_002690 [Candidatus Nitrospira kreftii]